MLAGTQQLVSLQRILTSCRAASWCNSLPDPFYPTVAYHKHQKYSTFAVTASILSGQPSRGANKREAQRMVEMATLLCELGKKQLLRLQQTCPEEDLFEAITIAQSIPKQNQGRRRQVNLVAKMLRGMDEEERHQIQAMASNLRHGQDSKDEQGANACADSWMAGLLAGDRAVVDLIDSMPPHWHDLQRIRQLVRRCRQDQEEVNDRTDYTIGDGALDTTPIANSNLQKQLKRELQLLATQYQREQCAGPEE